MTKLYQNTLFPRPSTASYPNNRLQHGLREAPPAANILDLDANIVMATKTSDLSLIYPRDEAGYGQITDGERVFWVEDYRKSIYAQAQRDSFWTKRDSFPSGEGENFRRGVGRDATRGSSAIASNYPSYVAAKQCIRNPSPHEVRNASDCFFRDGSWEGWRTGGDGSVAFRVERVQTSFPTDTSPYATHDASNDFVVLFSNISTFDAGVNIVLSLSSGSLELEVFDTGVNFGGSEIGRVTYGQIAGAFTDNREDRVYVIVFDGTAGTMSLYTSTSTSAPVLFGSTALTDASGGNYSNANPNSFGIGGGWNNTNGMEHDFYGAIFSNTVWDSELVQAANLWLRDAA